MPVFDKAQSVLRLLLSVGVVLTLTACATPRAPDSTAAAPVVDARATGAPITPDASAPVDQALSSPIAPPDATDVPVEVPLNSTESIASAPPVGPLATAPLAAPVPATAPNAAVASVVATPVATPDPRDYLLGPQDLVEVSVFGVPELSGTARINPRGQLSLPLIGAVDAAGLTSEQLAERISAALEKDYLQDANVTVFIQEYASQRLTVEGAVVRPGIYIMNSQTTLLQGIALAQGLGPLADPGNVTLFRADASGQRTASNYDLSQIRDGAVSDPLLRGSDVVVVQRSGQREFLRDSVFRDAVDLLNPFSRLPF